MKKISFKNADGSLNGKLIAGIISLLIVLIQQVLAMFGIKFTGNWSAIIAVVNTVLTILGMLGVITDVQTVTVPTTVASDEESQVETTANKVADEVQGPASTVAVADIILHHLMSKRCQNPPHKQVNSSIIKY